MILFLKVVLLYDIPYKLNVFQKDLFVIYENYQIRVWRDDTIYGTYFFSTEKSEDSIIKEDKKVIPGKWRSCEVNLSKRKHTYSVELLDKGKKVFVRCLGNQ